MVTRTHPRLHEEHGVGGAIVLAAIDSPPFARGIPSPPFYFEDESRLTPVCTGNTTQHLGLTNGFWTHPRLHGEYTSYPGLILASSAL